MDIIGKINELKQQIRAARTAGKLIGFVPTMGYLHEGHLTLMRRAKVDNGFVVASIFVNPLQFGPKEDFASYPRDLDRDACLAAQAGVDALFAPSVAEMYPQGLEQLFAFVDIRELGDIMCGASRPGHFRGVATVVSKLFHIVEPDSAYFGQKDAQQVAIIRRMVQDLNMNIRIKAVPTVRETDGLALSSRNVYLNPAERQAAPVLFRSLRLAEDLLRSGEEDALQLAAEIRRLIEQEPLAQIDYIAVSDPEILTPLNRVTGPALVALAVRIGRTRLIDNLLWPGRGSQA